MSRVVTVVVALALFVSSCGGGQGAGSCTPGASASCACSSGRMGAQVCRADGTFGPCTCAPTCGAANNTVPCGSIACPANSVCTSAANERCQCNTGLMGVTCDGQPCAGTCTYPNWWCQPCQPGVCNGDCPCPAGQICDAGACIPAGSCGNANFIVPCGGGFCPTNSTCTSTTPGHCQCNAGLMGVDCQGNPCAGSCASPNWWCQPCQPGLCNADCPCPPGHTCQAGTCI